MEELSANISRVSSPMSPRSPSPTPLARDDQNYTLKTQSSNLKRKKQNQGDDVLAMVGKRLALTRPEDKFDVIGKTWSQKLREMNGEQVLYAEKLINDILFEGQLGNLNRYCKFQKSSSNQQHQNHLFNVPLQSEYYEPQSTPMSVHHDTQKTNAGNYFNNFSYQD